MKLSSHIYIDGGDPAETRQANDMLLKAGLGGLKGQTTNPTLIAKRFASSKFKVQSSKQEKISEKEAIAFYRKTVEEMSRIIPEGNISIQVIGDPATLTAEAMLSQARDRVTWIKNGVVKFPCTTAGLTAVEQFCEEGPVNITLNFSQDQAAAVYAATKTHNYEVYVSPFVGRLDDKGENGMDDVANELAMYKMGDGHVNVLTASTRQLKHHLYALWLKSPVITLPFKVFQMWADAGFPLPEKDFIYDMPGLVQIPYRELTLDKDWKEYNIVHPLTDSGLARFWEDWQSIVQ